MLLAFLLLALIVTFRFLFAFSDDLHRSVLINSVNQLLNVAVIKDKRCSLPDDRVKDPVAVGCRHLKRMLSFFLFQTGLRRLHRRLSGRVVGVMRTLLALILLPFSLN